MLSCIFSRPCPTPDSLNFLSHPSQPPHSLLLPSALPLGTGFGRKSREEPLSSSRAVLNRCRGGRWSLIRRDRSAFPSGHRELLHKSGKLCWNIACVQSRALFCAHPLILMCVSTFPEFYCQPSCPQIPLFASPRSPR